MSQLTAKLIYEPAYDEFSLFVRQKEFITGFVFYLENCTIRTFSYNEPAKAFISPEVNPRFNAKEFCQAIMDEGWNNGMRPTGFTDIKNETTALKYHLEDMRKLVFKGK